MTNRSSRCLWGVAAAVAWLSGTGSAPGADTPPWVGANAHGAANIEALAELGVGNFVWIPKPNMPQDGNTPWDADHGLLQDVDACVRRGLAFMISQGRGLGLRVRPGGMEYGGDGNGLLHPAATITETVKRGGALFVGLHAEELDADLVQSALRPGFRSRLPGLYRFTDRAGGRQRFEEAVGELRTAYRGYGPGVRFLPNLCITHQLSGFRAGGDLVLAELLEHLPTTELQLAYLRGGARQFAADWGIWVSPWLAGRIPCEDKTLWPAPYAVPGGGHSASALRRCLYLAWASGARLFTAQNTEPILARRDPANPAAGLRLAAWGTELKAFWDYVRERPARVQSQAGLALLVDRDNGWAPGHLWGDWAEHESVWGKLPVERGDRMLSTYLDVLLPGYGRTAETWKKQVLYPGTFAATPAGPFDVVASDIRADRLAGYGAVALMADVRMTPELLATLRTYVGQGGKLLVNVDQMRCDEDFVQDPEFLGATIGESSFYVAWVGAHVPGRRIWVSERIRALAAVEGAPAGEYTEPWFCAQDVEAGTARVLADDGQGHPVLLANAFGRGTVYLTTPEYMLEGYGEWTRTLGYFRGLLQAWARSTPAAVDRDGGGAGAPPDLSWVAARQGDAGLVVVANHGSEPCQAAVSWGEPCADAAVEVGVPALSTEALGTGRRLRVRVPAGDVVVLRFAPVAAPSR